MAILAWIFGVIGGLCMVMGIITAVALIPEFAALTWVFWLALSGVLVLISIAFAVGRTSNYE